jgi:cation:H+ antiporter
MEILISLGSILLGLVLLTFGGNALVDGAVTLAKKWNISEAIIGLTIVAVGTSMPELIVSLLAAVSGSSDIAIGNVLGSNIANVFLILGATAIIAPMMLTRVTRFFDLPILMLVTLLLLLVSSDVLLDGSATNMIGRIDGLVFLLGAIGYILYSIKHNNMTPDESDTPEVMHSLSKAILWVGAGIVILFI